MKLEVKEVIENEDGTSSVVFDYDDDFFEVIKKELKSDSPSEEEISEFLLKVLQSQIIPEEVVNKK